MESLHKTSCEQRRLCKKLCSLANGSAIAIKTSLLLLFQPKSQSNLTGNGKLLLVTVGDGSGKRIVVEGFAGNNAKSKVYIKTEVVAVIALHAIQCSKYVNRSPVVIS